uniref:TIL domain-containing protein n=1 Tax=Elaeophora elaphi TaxID=1147741 RepID=A0A0R3RLR1_9BILA
MGNQLGINVQITAGDIITELIWDGRENFREASYLKLSNEPLFFLIIKVSALVLTSTCVNTNRQRKCGKNEIWTDCKGCELKCGQSEFVSNSKTPCFLRCDPAGCYCPPYDGFRRNTKNKCVAASECPRTSTGRDKKFLNTTS